MDGLIVDERVQAIIAHGDQIKTESRTNAELVCILDDLLIDLRTLYGCLPVKYSKTIILPPSVDIPTTRIKQTFTEKMKNIVELGIKVFGDYSPDMFFEAENIVIRKYAPLLEHEISKSICQTTTYSAMFGDSIVEGEEINSSEFLASNDEYLELVAAQTAITINYFEIIKRFLIDPNSSLNPYEAMSVFDAEPIEGHPLDITPHEKARFALQNFIDSRNITVTFDSKDDFKIEGLRAFLMFTTLFRNARYKEGASEIKVIRTSERNGIIDYAVIDNGNTDTFQDYAIKVRDYHKKGVADKNGKYPGKSSGGGKMVGFLSGQEGERVHVDMRLDRLRNRFMKLVGFSITKPNIQ